MANIVDVFFEIMAIAREKIPEIERQSQAAKRIDQFKADIASLRMRKGVTEGIYERLRDKLRAAAGSRTVGIGPGSGRTANRSVKSHKCQEATYTHISPVAT